MASARRVVGIIGGMGPEATVELMRRIISQTPARRDEDHLHLIVESNPQIPSRIAHLVEHTGADPTPELVRIAQNLQRAGADLLAMPCNTAHGYASAIQESVSIPLLNMVQLTVGRLAGAPTAKRVGLLASTAVHNTGLYARALEDHGLAPVRPARQEDVMKLIKGVKRGETGAQAIQQLGGIARELAEHADCLLVACSELSLISAGIDPEITFVDSLDVLTLAIVNSADSRGANTRGPALSETSE